MKINIVLKIFIIFFITFNVFAAKNNLTNTFITAKDFVALKFELFFSKNKNRIFNNIGFMVKYQSLRFEFNINENEDILVKLEAIMDKKKYKSKKYYPKKKDCNILRNKLFLNKHGYSFWKQERNYSFDEDDLREIIKREIFTIQNLSENQIDKIIDKTIIEIDIVHPRLEKGIRCKGNIAQVVLD